MAADDLERAEALLELAGTAALAFDDAGNDPVLEPPPGVTPLWPKIGVRALFPADTDLASLVHLLEASGFVRGEVALRALPDMDWRTTGRSIAARSFGERLWLRPAGDEAPPPARQTCVTLNMGLAFGTGQHPTTALCLEWLASHIRPGVTLVDYGCGSGVLAIAALALGASHAWAVDNDPQALTATVDNARLNGVADRLWSGLPQDLPPLRVDWLVANILAGPLEQLPAVFAAHLGESGGIALSGLLVSQREPIVAAYSPYFENFATAELDGWLRLDARASRSG